MHRAGVRFSAWTFVQLHALTRRGQHPRANPAHRLLGLQMSYRVRSKGTASGLPTRTHRTSCPRSFPRMRGSTTRRRVGGEVAGRVEPLAFTRTWYQSPLGRNQALIAELPDPARGDRRELGAPRRIGRYRSACLPFGAVGTKPERDVGRLHRLPYHATSPGPSRRGAWRRTLPGSFSRRTCDGRNGGR